MTAKLLAALRDVLGLVLLDLGQASLLLSLELEAADLLPCVANTLAGSDQGAVGLALGGLGTHDTLAGLQDRGIHLVVAAELGEKAAMALATGVG